VLLLQLLLGLEPDRARHRIVTAAPEGIPNWAGTLKLSGLRAFGLTWEVKLEDGAVNVEEH
jgi:hypothetical protein